MCASMSRLYERVFLALLFFIISVPSAFAATYSVTSTSLTGPGSFLEAIDMANTNPGPDVIEFTDGLQVDAAGADGVSLSDYFIANITESVVIDGKGRSSKCDLCLDTPFWNEKGGPGGKQACVETCPMKAIKFVSVMPEQKETEGYDVNLRNDHWLNLGLVDKSTVVPKMDLTWRIMPGGEE